MRNMTAPLTVAGLLAGCLAVSAQEVSEGDVDELNYCLAEVGYKGSTDPWDCVGFITDFCRKNVENPSTEDDIACFDLERAVWRTVLANSVKNLEARMDPANFERLQRQRSASPAQHAKHCGADGELSMDESRCLRDMMARRAIFITFSAERLPAKP